MFNRCTNAKSITWDWFSESFLDSVFPRDLRKAKAQEFMNIRLGDMKFQYYRLNFAEHSRHSPHMVADSKAHTNMFLYGVSDLMKIESKNSMLLWNMNISFLIIHAQLVDENKLKEHDKDNKNLRLETMTILSIYWVVDIACSISRSVQPETLYQLVLHSPRSNR